VANLLCNLAADAVRPHQRVHALQCCICVLGQAGSRKGCTYRRRVFTGVCARRGAGLRASVDASARAGHHLQQREGGRERRLMTR
jgi:hypothetical protein